MSREFKEVVEVTTVTDEYYRYIPSGIVVALEEIHTVRSQRTLEGDYTTRYLTYRKGVGTTQLHHGVEFLNGNWEKISREQYLTAD